METDTYQFPLSQPHLHGRPGLPPELWNIKYLPDGVDINVDNERDTS